MPRSQAKGPFQITPIESLKMEDPRQPQAQPQPFCPAVSSATGLDHYEYPVVLDPHGNGVILLPLVFYFLIDAFQGQSELPWRLRLRASPRSLGRQLLQAGLNLIFLPYEAYFSLDAVLRSWNRMLFTHRHLLEWRTSWDSQGRSPRGLAGFYSSMWIAPVAGLASGILPSILQARSLL